MFSSWISSVYVTGSSAVQPSGRLHSSVIHVMPARTSRGAWGRWGRLPVVKKTTSGLKPLTNKKKRETIQNYMNICIQTKTHIHTRSHKTARNRVFSFSVIHQKEHINVFCINFAEELCSFASLSGQTLQLR